MVPYTQSSPQMTSEIISLMDIVYWCLCCIIIISRLRGTLSHHKATLGGQTDSIHCSLIQLSQCVISPYLKTSIKHIGIFFTHDVCYIQWSVDIFSRMSFFNLKQLHLITCMDKHLRSGVLWPRARPQLTAFSHNDWTSSLASHRLGTQSQSCSFCCGLKRKFQKAQRPSSQQHNLLISVAGTESHHWYRSNIKHMVLTMIAQFSGVQEYIYHSVCQY